MAEFRASLSGAAPAPQLNAPLAALWWAAKSGWDQAHKLVQDEATADAAWVHAYLHRVEGDLGNAGYWYRQAGKAVATRSLEAEWAADFLRAAREWKSMSATNSKLIRGATGDWEVVIGMEVHAQVTSNSKLFSGASTEFGGEPNSHVSLVDAAMPGMLPVINKECVRQAVRTGLGLNAKINLRSVFDRKNYFYPDLPQGYQISQYKSPVVGEGEVVVELAGGESVTVGIERLHLEQDAGKLLHDQSPTMSFVDLNRSGVALMEIVSKPDIRSSEQAKAYVTKLRSILRYLGTCDGDMEKGSLRADVNVSVRKPGEALGTRCEIKNMNSIAFIGQAIEYEARRQIGILEDGGAIDQETRLFDPNKGETRSMRSKEEAHDYRYFPDPDLLPLEFTQGFVDELKAESAGIAGPEESALHRRVRPLAL